MFFKDEEGPNEYGAESSDAVLNQKLSRMKQAAMRKTKSASRVVLSTVEAHSPITPAQQQSATPFKENLDLDILPASGKENLHSDSSSTSNMAAELLARGIQPSVDPGNVVPRPIVRQVQLDLSDKRTFLMQPVPQGITMQCQILRDRSGLNKLFPQFLLYNEDPNTFLLAARKRKKNRSSNYLISLDPDDLSRSSLNFYGKLRSNILGTEFVIYDKGEKVNKAIETSKQLRSELGCILYETNILGSKGPRKMTVVIPSIGDGGERAEFPYCGQTIVQEFNSNQKRNIEVFHSNLPTWSEKRKAYVLDFHGRVTHASIKNFQLVSEKEPGVPLVQFGKIGDEVFTLDVKYPFSCLQAFAIALSSFDNKLACE